MTEQEADPTLSVVVPMLDEEENLDQLLAELSPVLCALGSHEIMFVDDGSRDQSRELVLKAREHNRCVKLIELSRNFGHQAALIAGLDHARGRAVVLMDADLQDPPTVITEFVARWRAGADVVYGIRSARKEGRALRACFFVFYRVLQRLSDTELPLDSGDFCLMDRRVVDAIGSLPEPGRYLRGHRSWVGFSQCGVTYERAARHGGETKFSVRNRLSFAWDGWLAFSDVPLRLAPRVSAACGMIGIGVLVLVAAMAVFGISSALTSGLAYVALALVTVQMAVLGIVASHLARVHDRNSGRPPYIVRQRHGVSVP